MTAIPLGATSAPTVPRAKTIFYVRAVVALGMIGAWAVSAASGIVAWLAADGRGAGRLPLLFGADKHAWVDVHVAISTLAIILTITHLTVMRRGGLAYARLLLTGQRNPTARAARRPKAIVFVRAVVVVTMLSLVPVVIASGVVHWLAADGQHSGQQLLLFAVTKRGWGDIHTAFAIAAVMLAVTHLAVVRTGLAADVRLLVTGQRSSPRRVVR
ncbi:MAG: hypothetical protein ABIG85_07655 [Chloroflexota bacterium]